MALERSLTLRTRSYLWFCPTRMINVYGNGTTLASKFDALSPQVNSSPCSIPTRRWGRAASTSAGTSSCSPRTNRWATSASWTSLICETPNRSVSLDGSRYEFTGIDSNRCKDPSNRLALTRLLLNAERSIGWSGFPSQQGFTSPLLTTRHHLFPLS